MTTTKCTARVSVPFVLFFNDPALNRYPNTRKMNEIVRRRRGCCTRHDVDGFGARCATIANRVDNRTRKVSTVISIRRCDTYYTTVMVLYCENHRVAN